MSKPAIKPGDFHLVVSHAYRTMKVFESTGKMLHKIAALTEGWADDPNLVGGDTPPGLYRVGKVYPTTKADSVATLHAYGRYCIDLVDLDNQETGRGRAGISIHGGGTGLSDPLAANQPLVQTSGCIRVRNCDLETIITPLVKRVQRDGHVVYVSVVL